MARGRSLRTIALAVVAFAGLVAVGCAVAQIASAFRGPAAGGREGRLVIYSATDEQEASELLKAFRIAHPEVQVEYLSLRASEVYSRFKAEADRGDAHADLLVNSAMDLQIKLVNDGYAQAYQSPERTALPEWAIWKDEAYAVTAEPIVFGYNAKLLPQALVPKTHDDLAAVLRRNTASLAGRVGSYDPLKSPTGYLYLTQDIRSDSDSWDLIGALGQARPRLFVSSKEMIDQISSGQLLLGYNLIGSYAFERAAMDPNFRVIVPQDFVLMMSRVAVIPKRAPHPQAARLFLDFMLSRPGQTILAKHHMTPVRMDMARDQTPSVTTIVRAVRVGPALMAGIDRLTFDHFRKKWLAATAVTSGPAS
jgi:iron(III) transport system substrate-binding protein